MTAELSPQLLAPRKAAGVRDTWINPEALRRILITSDVVALCVGWAIALVGYGSAPPSLSGRFMIGAAAVGTGLLTIAAQHLFRSRECAIPTIEASRLIKAAGTSVAASLVAASLLGLPGPGWRALLGGGASFMLLVTLRSSYRTWLGHLRRRGALTRRIVIVGANDEAASIAALLADHPELGIRAVGLLGREEDAADGLKQLPWIGLVEDATRCLAEADVNGVIIAGSAMSMPDLNKIIRELVGAGIHVHFSSGIRGIDHRRIRAQPLAHEPLYYLEPLSLARWQLVAKRALDLVLGSLAFALAIPVLVAAALAIKRQDGGPVLFRQERVGLNGELFSVLKFRTMVLDAESQLPEVQQHNERSGPLFKLAADPRVTPVGRLLRASSIDELPQLVNVLRGQMSLVGPRPALPAEVAQFDDELQARVRVRPGMTGLWQVEARDNPSFSAYVRFDLFYIENWSVSLDIALLLATVRVVIGRCVGLLSRRRAERVNSALVLD